MSTVVDISALRVKISMDIVIATDYQNLHCWFVISTALNHFADDKIKGP